MGNPAREPEQRIDRGCRNGRPTIDDTRTSATAATYTMGAGIVQGALTAIPGLVDEINDAVLNHPLETYRDFEVANLSATTDTLMESGGFGLPGVIYANVAEHTLSENVRASTNLDARLGVNPQSNASSLGTAHGVVGGIVLMSMVPAPGAGAAPAASRTLLRTPRSLQKFFSKHAMDFGLSGTWNPGRAAEASRVIHQHINSSGVRQVAGRYRGADATHYVNPTTGLNVIEDAGGNFVSGWRLGAEQLESVISTGRLF